MGDVYQATDTKLGRSVAVKILPEIFARDADPAAENAEAPPIIVVTDWQAGLKK